ncbi:MAG TPA: hypothetical protein VJN90_13930 [Candidatus Acidoferrales bacterium]|nr:hypothetical protein [Candidatus Acidoferrales bacterium]
MDCKVQMQEQEIGSGDSSDHILPVKFSAVLRRVCCGLFALALLIPLPAIVHARAGGASLCVVEKLPTEIPVSLTAVSIRKHYFVSGPNSSAVLHIENLSSKPIIAVRFVFEYYGANGQRFGDVVAQAIARQVLESQAFPILKRMNGGGDIPSVIQPGNSASLAGIDWFATAVCPVRAKLTAAMLWFSDGTSVDWSAPDSRIDPESEELRLRDLPTCLIQHNFDRLFLALDLDRTGRVMRAKGFPPYASQKEPCGVEEVGAWKFQPALLGGEPVATKLNLLLRLIRRDQTAKFGEPALTRREASRPVTIVDAFAPVRPGLPWHILYAAELPQTRALTEWSLRPSDREAVPQAAVVSIGGVRGGMRRYWMSCRREHLA